MYRFSEERKIKSFFSGITISILIFVLLFVIFFVMLGRISDTTIARQEESLNTAINHCIVSCYCIEGTYPPSLSYMEDHYGLTYDSSLFFVDYQAIGSNIFPDVTVIRKADTHE